MQTMLFVVYCILYIYIYIYICNVCVCVFVRVYQSINQSIRIVYIVAKVTELPLKATVCVCVCVCVLNDRSYFVLYLVHNSSAKRRS